jgi:hypothetical protein
MLMASKQWNARSVFAENCLTILHKTHISLPLSLHRYLGVRVCRWQRRENEVVHRFQGPPPKHAGIGSIFLIKII